MSHCVEETHRIQMKFRRCNMPKVQGNGIEGKQRETERWKHTYANACMCTSLCMRPAHLTT